MDKRKHKNDMTTDATAATAAAPSFSNPSANLLLQQILPVSLPRDTTGASWGHPGLTPEKAVTLVTFCVFVVPVQVWR